MATGEEPGPAVERPLGALLFDLSYTLLTNGRTEAFHGGISATGRHLSPGAVHRLLGRADALFAERRPELRGVPVYEWIQEYVEVVAELLPGATEADRTMLLAATRPWAESGGAWRPFDDVVPALQELRAGGVRLAIVSNWGPAGHRVLDRCGLTERVDAVVLSGDVRVAKPHPDIFLRALALLGADAPEAAMVGDNYGDDILGAARAGLRGILLDRYGLDGETGRPAPCAIARSLRGVVRAAARPGLHLPPAGGAARRDAVAPAIPSSSVVIVRQGEQGPEVLLGIRPRTGVMPGMAVFPGGRLGEADGARPDEAGRGPSGGSGAPGGGRRAEPEELPRDEAFLRAAIRETFEETGIWLGGGEAPGPDERAALLSGEVPPRFRASGPRDGARESGTGAGVEAGAGGDARGAGGPGGVGGADGAPELVPIGWLETPPHLPHRFHTRFFVARLPEGALAVPNEDELHDLAWWRPEDALGAAALPLMRPTRAVLERLCGFATVDELIASARDPGRRLTPRAVFPPLP